MKRFRAVSIESNGETIPVSFSIGISTYPAVTLDMADKATLVEQAKQAMHESKRKGKDRITHYECMPG